MSDEKRIELNKENKNHVQKRSRGQKTWKLNEKNEMHSQDTNWNAFCIQNRVRA